MGFSPIKPGVLFAGLFVCGWPPGQFTTGTNPPFSSNTKKKKKTLLSSPSPFSFALSAHSSLPPLSPYARGGLQGLQPSNVKEGNNSITQRRVTHTHRRRHLLLAREPGGWSGPSRGLLKELLAIESPLTRGFSPCPTYFRSSSRSLRLWPWHRSK